LPGVRGETDENENAMSDVFIHRNRSYGSDPVQNGDLFLPVTSDAKPAVVVLVHGGFWSMPYDKSLMEKLALDLQRRGFAVWNIEYRRLDAPGSGWPGEFEDVANAVDHLTTFVRDGIALDLDRVASVGHSAGGHFALWIAGRHHIANGQPGASPRVTVKAAVGQAPVPDLIRGQATHVGHGVVEQLMGGPPSKFPERYAAASPRALLPLGVPQLVVHGDADRIVPLELSRLYVEEAKAVHDTVTLDVLPGVGHFEHIDPTTIAWEPVLPFLKKTLA
jgi:acetyl esterase/lipase